MLVSKPTHGGGAPLGIDLDAGVAKIRVKAKPAAEPTEPATAEPEHPDQPTDEDPELQRD